MGAGDAETVGFGAAEEGSTDVIIGATGAGFKSGEVELAATGAGDGFPFGALGGATTERGAPAALAVEAGDGFSAT
jgi:hypothetical protein